MKRRPRKSRAARFPPEKFPDIAAIIGLGGIGRCVATQLAAMGAPCLILADRHRVTKIAQAANGYMIEDIGRLRTVATAEHCHRINPRIEIHATNLSRLERIIGKMLNHAARKPGTPESPSGPSGPGNRRTKSAKNPEKALNWAVLVCEESLDLLDRVSRQLADQDAILGWCGAMHSLIEIGLCRCDRQVCKSPRLNSARPRMPIAWLQQSLLLPHEQKLDDTGRIPGVPIHVTTIAAGLVVHELVRSYDQDSSCRLLRFEITESSLTIETPLRP